MASTYTARHLADGQSFQRPFVLKNPLRKKIDKRNATDGVNDAVETFHKSLPDYAETKLHDLPQIASELGLERVFVKDESTRFGLPAFKILGASWATHKAVCGKLGIAAGETSIQSLAEKCKSPENSNVEIVTCTAGNWGRAVARMAKFLGVPVRVYVPGHMSTYTKNLIREEGADLKNIAGASYDDTVEAVRKDAAETGALIIQDVGWEGYEDVPRWVAEGYSTMLREADRQVAAATNGKRADLVIASAGAGVWAQSTVDHYEASGFETRVVTVEADTASGLKESLHCGANTPVATGTSIMDGMNCGTTTGTAWETLRDGVDTAVAVTDKEAHQEVLLLQKYGVNAGPCGAATLAGLRRICKEDWADRRPKIVVLFSTEGNREYDWP